MSRGVLQTVPSDESALAQPPPHTTLQLKLMRQQPKNSYITTGTKG